MYSDHPRYPGLCLYKKVADNDLRKHREKDPNITLGTMLMQYMELQNGQSSTKPDD